MKTPLEILRAIADNEQILLALENERCLNRGDEYLQKMYHRKMELTRATIRAYRWVLFEKWEHQS